MAGRRIGQKEIMKRNGWILGNNDEIYTQKEESLTVYEQTMR